MIAFLNNLSELEACNFIKKEALTQTFSVNFAKSLRTLFYRTPPVVASQKLVDQKS